MHNMQKIINDMLNMQTRTICKICRLIRQIYAKYVQNMLIFSTLSILEYFPDNMQNMQIKYA